MLHERYRQLLTAYVDGELSERQRRMVQRVLRRSSEARRLLRGLEGDSRVLRSLPKPSLDTDLSVGVVAAIADRKAKPRSPVRTANRPVRGLPTWLGVAAAAVVLLALGVASYLLFSASLHHDRPEPMAQRPEGPAPVTPPSPRPRQGDPTTPRGPEGIEAPPKRIGLTPPDKPPVARVPDSKKGPGDVVVPAVPKEEQVVTDRMEMFRAARVEVALPVILKVHELEQETARKQLLTELGKARDFRLELPCRSGTRAFERLHAGLRNLNTALVIDSAAQARLKVPQFPTNYVVYIEDLVPEELARLLSFAAQEDRKASQKKPLDGQFDRLVLTRMTEADHKELSVLLGVDPTHVSARKPGEVEVRKPLSDLTAEQVGKSLAGQGGAPRPEGGKPAGKISDRSALVLAYNPVRPHPGSSEIKRFLESRKPARPGSLRVLLVLRG